MSSINQKINFALFTIIFAMLFVFVREPVGNFFTIKNVKSFAEPIIKVPIFKAKSGSLIQSYVEAFGTLIPQRSVEVKFVERGRLAEIKDGIVNKGQVAIKLDTTEYDGIVKASISVAEKAVRQYIAAKLKKMVIGSGIDDMQFSNARNEAQKAIGELERAIGMRRKLQFTAPFTGRLGPVRYTVGQLISDDVVSTFSEEVQIGNRKYSIVCKSSQADAEHIWQGKLAQVIMPDGAVYSAKILKTDKIMNEFGYFYYTVEFTPEAHMHHIVGHMPLEVKIPRNDLTKEGSTYTVRRTAISMPTDTDRARSRKKPMFMFVAKHGRAAKIEIIVLATSGDYCKVYSKEVIDLYIGDGSIPIEGARVETDATIEDSTVIQTTAMKGIVPIVKTAPTIYELEALLCQCHEEIQALQERKEEIEKKLSQRTEVGTLNEYDASKEVSRDISSFMGGV